jgi:hypothetical protein
LTDGGVRGIGVGCGLLLITCVAPWMFYRLFTVADHHLTRTAIPAVSAPMGGTATMLRSIAHRSEQLEDAHGGPSAQSLSDDPAAGQGTGEGERSGGRVSPARTIDTDEPTADDEEERSD